MSGKIQYKGSYGAHEQGVIDLEKILKNKPWVDYVETNTEYPQGEIDVTAYNKNLNLITFYEYKSSNSKKSYYKSIKQMRRATNYFHRRDRFTTYYGVYVCPTKMEIVAKNGFRR